MFLNRGVRLMSTPDVPGANDLNHDELSKGCWAEHSDGSLILVEGFKRDQDKVVYSVFDVSVEPSIEYRDSMPEQGFKSLYSRAGWTWHDKTEFPWDRVMSEFKYGVRLPSAGDYATEAERIAKRRGMHRSELYSDDSRIDEPFRVDEDAIVRSVASRIIDRIQKALGGSNG